jgi:hypothetical protein
VKKLVVGAGVFVLALAVLCRFGPALGKRAMAKCQEMFDRMPEEFSAQTDARHRGDTGAELADPART